jgi:parallel beta-helix repeat protein
LALGLATLFLGPVGAAFASHSATHYIISKSGSNYVAQSTGSPHTGTLKAVVESAVADLKAAGGGTVTFQAGVFDLGGTYFRLENMTDITIEGQGIDVTFIQNFTTEAHDREPFNTQGATRVTIRDLTVSAGGPPRTTSDAIDFDKGNYNLVERVKITASRGKGIIFDGKDGDWTAVGNTVRNCDISGTNNDGIQFLASSNNRVEGCTIHDTVEDGIEARKSQNDPAIQANKKSNDNVIIGNTIYNAGQNGIRIHSSDRNAVTGNHITNSSDDIAGQDGIRITSGDSITCDNNRVEGNTATDTQTTKTQRYGLNIDSALCNSTFVGTNNFSGNLAGAIRDVGTNTQYGASDTQKPTAPTSLIATAVSGTRVDLSWTASTDNVGVTAYDVYRNGSPLAAIGVATNYSDTTTAASTAYQYQVRARDAAGNASGFSNTATITTPAASPSPPGPSTPTVPVPPSGSPPLCKGQAATLWGTAGADTLSGTPGSDVIVGRGAADTIKGGGGNDLVCAGPGADTIFGGTGNDHVLGGTGSDTERGGKGRDRLVGGKGKDTCSGGPGKDTAVGCELGSGP